MSGYMGQWWSMRVDAVGPARHGFPHDPPLRAVPWLQRVCLAVCFFFVRLDQATATHGPNRVATDIPLTSAPYFNSIFTGHADPVGLFQTLNLSHPTLSTIATSARKCIESGDGGGGKSLTTGGACTEAAAALLEHYRRSAAGWGIVSHTYPFLRSIESADLAVANITARLGGATTTRTVHHGTAGINWTQNPFWETLHDAEWAWGLHRQPFWLTLAYAYRTTQDERYFEAWASQFTEWLRLCPRDPMYNYDFGLVWEFTKKGRKRQVGKSNTWPNPVNPALSWAWRRVDAGRRSLQIGELLQLFLKSPNFSPELLVKVLRSVHEHGEFLAGNPHHAFTRDNHGLFEAEGAAAVGILFPEFTAAEQWRARSFAVLQREMQKQVRLDGMQIENSIAYQSSTIRILTDTPVLAEKNGFPGFPSWYWWRVRLMLEALAALAFPTGLSVQFGDQASRLNTTTVIKNFERLVAAKTDGSPVAVAGGARVDPSVPEAVRLPYSGFYSIRGGSLGTNGTTLVLRCGSSYNAHSHKDAGTFELASWGNILLSDSGCFTYTGIKEIMPKDKDRQFFQGTAAHQSLTLDRHDAHIPSLLQGPFQKLKGYDDCGLLLWRSTKEHVTLVVENRDTYRDPDLSHRRAVVYFAKFDVFVVIDEALGHATGNIEVHFHVDAANVTVDAARLAVQTMTPSSSNVLIRGTGTSAVTVSVRDGRRSPAMGKEVQRSSISFAQRKTSGTAAVRFVTLVAPYAGLHSPALSASVVEPAGSTTVTVQLHQSHLIGDTGTNVQSQSARQGQLVDTVRYDFDAEMLEMAPPPLEFQPGEEKRYTRYYDNFRHSERSVLPLRVCRKTCSPQTFLQGGEAHVEDVRRSLVYVPAKGYLYCGIPKCGVSRWRRLSRRVSGVPNWADNKAHNTDESGLLYVAKLVTADSVSAAMTVLNDPTLHAFAIVRSPYARVLSSWLDKRNFPRFNLPQTFELFVNWVVGRTDAQLNEHFTPMSSFCGITEGVHFDAFYKLEELETWGPELVRQLNLTDAVSSGWNGGFFRSSANVTHNHFSDKRLQEYYNARLMALVAERYKLDFKMFGYDPKVLA